MNFGFPKFQKASHSGISSINPLKMPSPPPETLNFMLFVIKHKFPANSFINVLKVPKIVDISISTSFYWRLKIKEELNIQI